MATDIPSSFNRKFTASNGVPISIAGSHITSLGVLGCEFLQSTEDLTLNKLNENPQNIVIVVLILSTLHCASGDLY